MNQRKSSPRWRNPPGHHEHFGVEVDDGRYERTWRLLFDAERIRGAAARMDGEVVGIAHYLFHPSVWGAGRCHLADAPARALYDEVGRFAEGLILYTYRRDANRSPGRT
ncbi:hypothetical protein [Saccharothrix coeruleofusca]|uniref:N-acetyltransferase domain-containing protein n=1 Tax=Saccharothrix coeruleofusca TaxID=33919 RepID=A0A918EGU8_9PSEU|nr:hypothetical protein [Saccharothrix coeruleofusca]GGP84430.1 hypothetical protein GCM10010185_67870 [Saccharothrix coeruleofusca]